MTAKEKKINQTTFRYLIALVFSFVAFSTTPTLAQNKIAVSVNKDIVTSYQITQRSRFLRLTGFKGDSVAEARRQLIKETLQFQEAERVELRINPEAVERAFENLAKGNGARPEQFEAAFRARGVNTDTLKRLIKARITWQNYVVARSRSENAPKKAEAKKDVTSILFNKNSGGGNRRTKEYTIEQYVFILQNADNEQLSQQRLREVEAFRRSHATCTSANQAARNLVTSGVVTKSLGRYTESTLPKEIKDDVLAASDALFTKPKRIQAGIEVMAICQVREIADNSVSAETATSAFDIGKLDTVELQENSKKWLADIEKNAKIRSH